MRQKNKLNYIAAGGILLLFIITLVYPSFGPVAKVLALLLYALVCFCSLQEQRKRGEDIQKSAYFSIVVLLVIGYLLFFV